MTPSAKSTLPHADLELSRLGFGCASLMRVTSAKARYELLETAFDSGLRHFDVARLYGLGAAEAELGRFVRGRRDQLTIATKFGIEPASGLGALARFQQPARAFLNKVPAARKAIKRRHESLYAPRRYDAAIARRSLDTSLAELGVDYVDILFIHDCGPRDDVQVAELTDFFEAAKAAGKIRAWGVSQDAHPGFDVIDQLGSRAVLQVRHTIFDTTRRDRPHLSFGVLGGPLERISLALERNPAMRNDWAIALGSEPTPGFLARLLLADALLTNRDGSVLYSTIRAARIPAAADLLDVPPPAESVETLRRLVVRDNAAIG